MPYIKKTRRVYYDHEIEQLQRKLIDSCAEEGDYNYVISRIISTMFLNGPRYKWIARATGVLHNVADELYRRIGGRYENLAIIENDDIPEYRKINEMIDKKYIENENSNYRREPHKENE